MPAGRTDAVKGMKTGSGGAWGSTNYAAVDALGRVSSLKQTVAGLAEQSLSYEYSASGAVKSIVYPSGRQVNVAYTGAGRPSQVSSAARTYLSGMSYGANGALVTETWNGSGAERVEEKRSYNPLGQMLTADFRKNAQEAGRFWKMTNQFPETKNVGNLTKQYVETGIDTFGVRYAYDGLYRLIGAAEDSSNEDPLGTASCSTVGGRWCVQYAYDQFGNGWTPSKSGLALGLAQATSNWYLQSGGVVNNRLKDVAYDASGRQKQWNVGDTSSVAVYDPEGHMTEAKGDSVVTPGTEKIYGSYLYNGDGQRVKSVADGKTVWYVYGLDGGVAAEFATGYTNVNAGKTLYPVTDHLGSTRAWFDQTGTVTQRVDYEPFGGEIQRTGVAGYSGVGDPAQKFTAKERDAETGLDYFGARYLMAGQGRFGSPDVPLVDQHVEDPQSWNLYSYARNNPQLFVDPTGQRIQIHGDTEEERQKGLEALTSNLRKEAKSRVSIGSEKDKNGVTRYFVKIGGDLGEFMNIGGKDSLENKFCNMVNDAKVTEFALTDKDLSSYGGGVTAFPGEALAGNWTNSENTRILVNPNQMSIADSRLRKTVFGVMQFEGNKEGWEIRPMTLGIATWHEFGHAWGSMNGRTGSRSNLEASGWENSARERTYGPLGPKNARRRNHP